MTPPIICSLKGTLHIKKVTINGEKDLEEVPNQFTRNITMEGTDVIAYIISEE